METRFKILNDQSIFTIPVGTYFKQQSNACFLVYSPLANLFYLSLPNDVEELQNALISGAEHTVLARLLNHNGESMKTVTTTDTFCTLHLLLNEKCNFHCQYCYSAEGRSSQELSISQIETILHFFCHQKEVRSRIEQLCLWGVESLFCHGNYWKMLP